MSDIKLRINGRGNAWPVILGQDHPFYDRNNIEDLANASCSIIKSRSDGNNLENLIDWELLVDAGHGAVQFLLKNYNRIPEAVFITHPHIDHTLGLDWVVQSFYKTYNKPYPVYASILCWEFVKKTFPHLIKMIEFKELIPFEKKKVDEVSGIEVIAFPAYHGKSAFGAAMLYFKIIDDQIHKSILFTGDMLCPLLRKEDYKTIEGTNLLVSDANNRFPYPKSNHWSITEAPDTKSKNYLGEFLEQSSIAQLLEPHIKEQSTDKYARCFDYFLNKAIYPKEFYFTIKAFSEKIQPQKVILLHYSGGEDLKYYNELILDTEALELWVNSEINLQNKCQFIVPYVSQHIEI